MKIKAGRPGKSNRICNKCRKPSLPREGDWFLSEQVEGSQMFVCRDCERKLGLSHLKVVPAR